MGTPLVSVMMPCYNARDSLPWAIASVLAQTFEDWELVLVDDGSTDSPYDVVEQASDSRIRFIRLPENKGRPIARQVALDNARGEFLAMLDADDWMYPERLQVQIDTLLREPKISLVSAGLAILNRNGDIIRVRGTGNGTIRGPHRGLVSPVVHASSMYRSQIVGDNLFDRSLLTGEDQDFLNAILHEKYYAVLPRCLYAYSEIRSVSALKAAHALRVERQRARRYTKTHPQESRKLVLSSYLKEVVYRGAHLLKLDEAVIARRSNHPTDVDRKEYSVAKRLVDRVAQDRF